MRAKLRRTKFAPILQGGNGRLLTIPQLALLHALGEGWTAEYTIATGAPRGSGYPTNYKVDVANPTDYWAIEIDGSGHRGKNRARDAKKDVFIQSLGWRVSRISNRRALHLFSTFTSLDTLLTSLKDS